MSCERCGSQTTRPRFCRECALLVSVENEAEHRDAPPLYECNQCGEERAEAPDSTCWLCRSDRHEVGEDGRPEARTDGGSDGSSVTTDQAHRLDPPMYCPECDRYVREDYDPYDEGFHCPECSSSVYESKENYIEILHATARWEKENGWGAWYDGEEDDELVTDGGEDVTAAIDRSEYDFTDPETPEFRATFDNGVLKDIRAPLTDLDLWSVRLAVTEDSLLVEAANKPRTLAVSIELTPDAFDEWEVNATGDIHIAGDAYAGLTSILYQAQWTGFDPQFELTITEGGLSMQDQESSYGGKVPESGDDPGVPSVHDFKDELRAAATIKNTYDVNILTSETDIESHDARAELAAVDGTARLTFKDDDGANYLRLSDATHAEAQQEFAFYHPKYVTRAVKSFDHLSVSLDVLWGSEFPAVFHATTNYATHEAIVTPRLESEDSDIESPMYESADDIEVKYGGMV